MSELGGLDAVTEAVESGAGLPEVVRAASRALDASLAVTDAAGATIAVAARSSADERSLAGRRGRRRQPALARGRRGRRLPAHAGPRRAQSRSCAACWSR